MANPDDRDPLHHTQKMKARRQETIDHLRADVDKAEVLTQAFSDYERKTESAWRK